MIAGVGEGTPAAAAGFKAGDRVLAINGDETMSFEDVVRRVSLSEGQSLTFRIERQAREVEITATRTS